MKTAAPVSLLLLLCTTMCAWTDPYILEPVESEPVEIGGLEISLVTQAEWYLPRGGMKRVAVLQLRLKNPTDAPVLFTTFDTFQPKLADSDGEEIRFSGGRDGTRITPRIRLEPGAEFTYPLTARLEDLEGKGMHLVFEDHTGTWLGAEVGPGEYSLSFDLFPPHNLERQTAPEGVELWAAEGQTDQVKFTVHRSAE